ncbi:RNA-guided endonuclease InsQ/TnpB family protein [Nocardia sp. CDC160]|uniref:RNA-guided endonuclease InsQ/TnpB family protein n=1 Tax=Nocardia sp. CDC160 TaxID=3112166 RepID=UPI002DBA7948|nr:RNA-guided endonuclease TnpB family protein [Nocardia sp. CDC160]MEC3914812.1 RNA-guided endonuclease TnpB family protein [Nocardia sp. CDC160]
MFNDVLEEYDRTLRQGIPLSDSEIQKRVLTEAKRTPRRAWLRGVSSTILVQSANDASRAYRNWFDSLGKRRRGPRVGRPRWKSRKSRNQSIRFTRNAFGVTSRGVRLAKIGDVKLAWSRPLPSEPSSVTVIREADGRFYVSFVVQIETASLPEVETIAGMDLGLADLAVVVRSDGTREKVSNPRYLLRRQRRLIRAQKALSRKQKGSKNREKARIRLAAQHRRVRNARLDHHHKLALRLIRENQTIAVEDLAIAAMARSWLGKSVHEAGWAQLLRLLEEKAVRHGRRVVRVDRWTPTSRLCSVCKNNAGPKPLRVRAWTCTNCRSELDRDFNAALNVLDAAGLAESLNACGAGVRLRLAGAIRDEAGTH